MHAMERAKYIEHRLVMYGEFMSCFIVLIKKKQIIVCDMLLFYLLFTAGLYKLSDSLV